MITYLSFDGVLEPLGYSQIARPLMALGRPVTLLTLEKDANEAPALERRLRAHGITWRHQKFGGFSGNVRRLSALALDTAPRILHARSLQAGIVALIVQKTLNAKLLFDTRGCWAEQRRAQGRLPGLSFGVALGLERAVHRRADAIVTLTELAAKESPSATCIPTLVDAAEFTLARRRGNVPNIVRNARLVIGFVGAVNRDYRIADMRLLWNKIAARRKDAVLVVLSSQAHPFDGDRVVTANPAHTEIADWLSWIDWGFLMLRDGADKRASMPTKLGEFLLSGVRPIHSGCNSEVADWVARTGTGFSVDSLDAAADHIAKNEGGSLERGRAIALPHFDLARGVRKYDRIYSALLAAEE